MPTEVRNARDWEPLRGGWIRVLFMLLVIQFAALQAAHANDLPWKRQTFDLQANNEPLNVFVIRLFTLQGLPAITSASVATARVNGRFKGRVDNVFQEIADTYGLTWYYDGTAVYVYSMAEMESRLLQVEPPDVSRIEKTLRQMRLSDVRFPVRVSPEEGHVFIAGPPRYVEIVSDVVASVLGSPSRPKDQVETRIFRLKYARATDTSVMVGGIETRVPGVASILNELLGGQPSAQPDVRASSRAMSSLRGQGLASYGTARTSDASGAQGAPNSSSGGPTGGSVSVPSSPDEDRSGAWSGSYTPRSMGTGNTSAIIATADVSSKKERTLFVKADARLNAVIVREKRFRMLDVVQLVASLDVDVPLVEIEAQVIDVDDNKSEQFGIDWRAHGSHVDVISSPNGLAQTASDPSGANQALGLLAAGNPVSAGTGLIGTVLFGNQRDYFLSRVNVLADKGDAHLVSRPRILTADNLEAVLQNVREFYVRVAGQYQSDLFNVSLGLSMRVTPTVVDDPAGKRIKLQVRIEDGTTDGTGTVDQIPVVNRNTIATQATIGDGQSLLLGGYVIEERRNDKSGVPWLSDVPVLGWLFGQRSASIHRVERMFLITPRLVRLDQPTRAADPDPSASVVSPSSSPQAATSTSVLAFDTELSAVVSQADSARASTNQKNAARRKSDTPTQ